MNLQTIPLKYILEGDYLLPTPQRSFKWNKKWSKLVIEDILRDRPIGCLTVHKKGHSYEIIDGFKRIQSILTAFSDSDENRVSVDIATGLIVDANIIGGFVFPLSDIIDAYKYVDILRKIDTIEGIEYRKVLQGRAREISSLLRNYRIPLIEMNGLGVIDCYQVYRSLNLSRMLPEDEC